MYVRLHMFFLIIHYGKYVLHYFVAVAFNLNPDLIITLYFDNL